MPCPLVFLRLCVAWLLLVMVPAVLASTPPVTLDRALRVAADGDHFPAEARALEVTLPDVGADLDENGLAPRWYRLRVTPLAGSEQPLTLYLARACGLTAVDFNGQRLLGDALLDAHPLACQEPLRLTLPTTLWVPGENRIDLRIAGPARPHVASLDRAAGVSAAALGSADHFEPAMERHAVWQRALPPAIGAAMLMLGVLALTVGWLNTHKSYLLWFGLMSIGWAVFSAGPVLLGAVMSAERIEWLFASLAAPLAATAVLFLMRYAGMQSRVVEAVLFAQCVAVPAGLMLGDTSRLYTLSGLWYLTMAGEVLLAAAAALRVAWRVRVQEFWIMGALLAVMAVTVLADLLRHQGLTLDMTAPLWRLALPLALTVLGARLVYLEVAALRMAEQGARGVIERRVAEAAAEAERQYATLAELRVEQVTERERKRIAADLHDDLGAKLLTIVHTSESDRISTLAREALEEMRLSVRGLTGKPVRLSDALGDWRAEVVSRLGQANIGATWQGPAEELPQTLPARAYVQTTRILREAVSNIIKHSGASRCSVSGAVRDSDFVLTIQDNGKGIPMELDGKLDRGHGMTSMKQRAKGLQGQCLVESGPGFGTVIRLTIPL